MTSGATGQRGRVPADFIWGTATAAYQIEGGYTLDGKGPSIWDTFAHTQGKIQRGDHGDIACDHYQRWRDDLDLMTRMGLNGYRLSISWPRVQPRGAGAINAAGMDFYENLIDGLLERNITPYVTLYHWDLPQALQDAGDGWLNRDTASRFADYADLVTRRLGDRVKHWITLNEPYVSVYLGYVTGDHAPGMRGLGNYFPVLHHLLLGHGLALQPMRSNIPDARIGIAYSLMKMEPATDRDEDITAAERADALCNTCVLDPVLRGRYPDAMKDLIDGDIIHSGDLQTISAPTDMIGVNYYLRRLVKSKKDAVGFEVVPPRTNDLTAMGWEIYPQGLDYWLRRVANDYPNHTIAVTENGTARPEDAIAPDGAVHDARRTEYLRDHITIALDAMADGVPLTGYFVWAFMDNFEWALGYMPRFGLVYVDFPSQRRIIKDSGHWYGRLAETGDPDEASR